MLKGNMRFHRGRRAREESPFLFLPVNQFKDCAKICNIGKEGARRPREQSSLSASSKKASKESEGEWNTAPGGGRQMAASWGSGLPRLKKSRIPAEVHTFQLVK